MMKRTIYIFVTLCLLASCKQAPKPTEQESPLTKLEQLYQLPPDSVIPFFDLSGDSLTEFPDLSHYTIAQLNLSGNLLDTVDVHLLPKGLHELNISGNRFSKFPDLSHCNIDSLDLSHNQLSQLVYKRLPNGIRWLDMSHNCMSGIFCYGELTYGSIEKIEKVDLSYNKIRGLRLDSHSRGHDLRDEPFKDLVFMRKSDETGSGSWYLLELPADSLISYPHLDYNDKGVIAYVKSIA